MARKLDELKEEARDLGLSFPEEVNGRPIRKEQLMDLLRNYKWRLFNTGPMPEQIDPLLAKDSDVDVDALFDSDKTIAEEKLNGKPTLHPDRFGLVSVIKAQGVSSRSHRLRHARIKDLNRLDKSSNQCVMTAEELKEFGLA